MSDPFPDADSLEVKRAAEHLGEKWDAVVILCTRAENGRTRSTFKGSGNWHAQYGMVAEWIATQNERTRLATAEEGNDDGARPE